MHSRIYVLKEIKSNNSNSKPYEDRYRVSEYELSESFCPEYGDYVGLIDDKDEIKNDLDWLCDFSNCLTVSYKDNIPYLTFNKLKGLNCLRDYYNTFNELKDKITFEKFIDPYNPDVYELKMAINNTHSFWIITINDSDNGRWWSYDTFKDWLRDQCSSKSSKLTFRVEDVFDYHY